MRKLGTLKELLVDHGPTRDDVTKWAREEARIETLKYKKEEQTKSIQITFRSDQKLDYEQQAFCRGGYLFPQSFYYRLQLHKACRKLRDKYRFKYDINAILSDLIYARILEPASKRSSYKTASEFLEKPSYQLHDIYRALDVLGEECDFIQAEVYKNSHLLGKRNDPAQFIGKIAVTDEGEAAKIHNYLDTDKIDQEALYDGIYAVTTDLLDDDVLEKELGYAFTCETILDKLKTMNFADIQEQGFIPLYTRDKLTDALHRVCGFDTDFKFITKSHMRTIQKKSKGRE